MRSQDLSSNLRREVQQRAAVLKQRRLQDWWYLGAAHGKEATDRCTPCYGQNGTQEQTENDMLGRVSDWLLPQAEKNVAWLTFRRLVFCWKHVEQPRLNQLKRQNYSETG